MACPAPSNPSPDEEQIADCYTTTKKIMKRHLTHPSNPRSGRALRRSLLSEPFPAPPSCRSQAPWASRSDVFYIALENHNWTQPNGNVTAPGASSGTLSSIQQISAIQLRRLLTAS